MDTDTLIKTKVTYFCNSLLLTIATTKSHVDTLWSSYTCFEDWGGFTDQANRIIKKSGHRSHHHHHRQVVGRPSMLLFGGYFRQS